MDYSVIRNAWGVDAREMYSTPLDKLPMKKNPDKSRGSAGNCRCIYTPGEKMVHLLE